MILINYHRYMSNHVTNRINNHNHKIQKAIDHKSDLKLFQL